MAKRTTYTVVGNHAVDGVEPGGTVKIEDEERAQGLIDAGHIAEPDTPAAREAKKDS